MIQMVENNRTIVINNETSSSQFHALRKRSWSNIAQLLFAKNRTFGRKCGFDGAQQYDDRRKLLSKSKNKLQHLHQFGKLCRYFQQPETPQRADLGAS